MSNLKENDSLKKIFTHNSVSLASTSTFVSVNYTPKGVWHWSLVLTNDSKVTLNKELIHLFA